MAAKLYATKGGSSPSDLYVLDPATSGILTDVGPVGYAVTGLAVDPTTGILYGSTSNQDPTAPRSIITIDTTTGAGTLIGSLGLGAISPAADIAFDASGQLFGWVENAPDSLATINKATGAATLAPNSSSFNTFGDALDFDALGTLWAFIAGGPRSFVTPPYGYVFTINTTTGIETRQSRLTGGPVISNPPVSGGKFDASGTFWAIFNDFPTCYLVTIDVATGIVTNVGTMTGTGWDGLAWVGSAPVGCLLSLSPTAVSVVQGGTATSLVTSSLQGGPDSTVTLSATGLPTGVTAVFSANPIDENGGTSTVTVSADLTATPGASTVTIHGVDGNGNTCTKPITVTVTAFSPPPGGGFSVRERVPFN